MATRTRTSNNEVHAIELPELKYGSNKKIVDFVDVKMEQIRSTRDRLERQWYLNIAYYLGHQYLQWDTHSKRLYLPYAPKGL